jgi:hypothetical protein
MFACFSAGESWPTFSSGGHFPIAQAESRFSSRLHPRVFSPGVPPPTHVHSSPNGIMCQDAHKMSLRKCVLLIKSDLDRSRRRVGVSPAKAMRRSKFRPENRGREPARFDRFVDRTTGAGETLNAAYFSQG